MKKTVNVRLEIVWPRYIKHKHDFIHPRFYSSSKTCQIGSLKFVLASQETVTVRSDERASHIRPKFVSHEGRAELVWLTRPTQQSIWWATLKVGLLNNISGMKGIALEYLLQASSGQYRPACSLTPCHYHYISHWSKAVKLLYLSQALNEL